MTGNRLALTARDRQLLSEVARFGVMTRSQLMRLGLFASKSRANERLKKLVDAGYLTSRRQPLLAGGPQLVYGPGLVSESSRDARKRLARTSDLFLVHQLGLVDIRLSFERDSHLTRWLSDKELTALSLGLSPDAFAEFEVNGLTYCAFIEYDRGTETLGRIELKVRKYVEVAFSGRFERTFGRKFFRVLLITDMAGRLTSLSQAAGSVTNRIVRLALLSELLHHGPLASIWRAPGGVSPHALISP